MWLSRRFNKPVPFFAESGTVTSAEKGKTEATSSLCTKDVSNYAPYGYSYSLPVGQELLLVNCRNGGAGAGVKMNGNSNLECGEIMIKSLGGAGICLKNDGTVVINDCFTFTRSGTIINMFGEEIIL